MVWKRDQEAKSESEKIRWELVPYTRGKGVDVGCGPFQVFPHFIRVDNQHHKVFGQDIKPDITSEADDLVFKSQSLDFVYSSHLLEHIPDYKRALKEWWRVIKPGGNLVLYLPHKKFYPNVGSPDANPDHKHDFLPEDIEAAMKEIGAWDLVENQERNEGEEYSFFQVYKKLNGEKCVYSWKKPKPDKPTCAVVRYGAFGDLMQASSVFAALKEAGYHVTLFSSPPGADVVRHDPNIDELILQDKDQVPNLSLGDFWKHLQKKYDKFVNLSESVEGTFLALSGRTNHSWPIHIRRKYMSVNYVEFQHELAGVPYKPKVKFYPDDAERAWARKERSKMGEFVIMWSLAGSAVHKTWPYLDAIIARLMLKHKNVDVVLVGGPECVILEAGWENEKRVHRTSGKWSIRQSLAFLYEADMVVGPETGVLNAAAGMSMPKIVFLSHSSVENLTRDWVNTVSLTSKNTACYPCHMLHHGWDHCKKDADKGVAACQSDISAEDMWDQMDRLLSEAMKMAA